MAVRDLLVRCGLSEGLSQEGLRSSPRPEDWVATDAEHRPASEGRGRARHPPPLRFPPSVPGDRLAGIGPGCFGAGP